VMTSFDHGGAKRGVIESRIGKGPGRDNPTHNTGYMEHRFLNIFEIKIRYRCTLVYFIGWR